MIVNRKWVKRNIGFDPISRPAPLDTFKTKEAAKKTAQDVDLRREIIDFDSEGPEGLQFLSFTKATGLSRFTDIKWPTKPPLADKVARKGRVGTLPAADVLVVTWTVDEGHALSRVLTPDKDSANDYLPYTHNFEMISKDMVPRCPARIAGRLGKYWTGKIGTKSVVYFKSDSHMSQDGPKLPNQVVWKQIIDEVKPKLVITTGTGGGIGKGFEVGDVILSPLVKFDCQRTFKRLNGEQFSSAAARYLSKAEALFKFNVDQLPLDNTRPPKIFNIRLSQLNNGVLTTDFFGFDTSSNFYKLQGNGDLSEMGDAVLGMVANQMKDQGEQVPLWVAVRNVSDPQIKSEGTIKEQAQLAAHIYKAFGRWSTVCSAIVCWALIAAEK